MAEPGATEAPVTTQEGDSSQITAVGETATTQAIDSQEENKGGAIAWLKNLFSKKPKEASTNQANQDLNAEMDRQAISSINIAAKEGSGIPQDAQAREDALQRLADSGKATSKEQEDLAGAKAYRMASEQVGGNPTEATVAKIRDELMGRTAQTQVEEKPTTVPEEEKKAA